jgi:hypothetical protein
LTGTAHQQRALSVADLRAFIADRPEIRVDLRQGDEWSRTLLTAYSDLLVVSEFGFVCTLAELYRGTPLQPV